MQRERGAERGPLWNECDSGGGATETAGYVYFGSGENCLQPQIEMFSANLDKRKEETARPGVVC